MDKKEVTKTKIPHCTTTSTEGGLLLKEENRDKIEEIRNSMKKDDSNGELMEKVIRFHIKRKYDNHPNSIEFEPFIKYHFSKIFECEFPIGTSIVGELYTTHETKDITKQEVEKYINENFENFNAFQDWVINEMCGDEEASEYSYEDKLNYVEDNLLELLHEYIRTHYNSNEEGNFRFYDYFFEENYEGENSILLNNEYITKWVETNRNGFSITVELIQDVLNKRFSTLDHLYNWYIFHLKQTSEEKVGYLKAQINACNQQEDYYEKSYNQLIQKESHYNQEVFPEVIKMMETLFGIEEVKIFCKLNAFKYRMRAGYKKEDVTKEIKKALDYEERYKNYNKK